MNKELREKIAKIICCLRTLPGECDWCANQKGCPESWNDLTDEINRIEAEIEPFIRADTLDALEDIPPISKIVVGTPEYYQWKEAKEVILARPATE
uniref:Uncharacterized protein n=1 Tax=viral metagenome TaxID=1070528 RepID=A0A6M3J3X1_9ZZZZ